MSLKSGTNSFHGEVYDYMRRKALAANSFLLNSRSAPKTDQYIDQYGFSVDGPIFKNKTFFLFTGEKYREGTPAPLFTTVPTPAMRNGDFSGLVDASGNLIRIYDPATGRTVQRRLDARSVPGQPDSGRPHQSDGAGDHAGTTRTRTTSTPLLRRGSRTWNGPSTSTRTCSGTGSGRSTTTSAPTTGPSSAGARTSGTRSAIGEQRRSAPVPARAASCRSGAPTARSSATGCTSSAPGPCSTCAPATPTSWSGAIPTTRSASIRRSSGPRASSSRCQARQSAASSPSSTSNSSSPCRAARRPTGTATTRFSPTCR